MWTFILLTNVIDQTLSQGDIVHTLVLSNVALNVNIDKEIQLQYNRTRSTLTISTGYNYKWMQKWRIPLNPCLLLLKNITWLFILLWVNKFVYIHLEYKLVIMCPIVER